MITLATTHGSVARRLSLQSLALLVGMLMAISVLMSVVAETRSRERIVQWVGDKLQSVVDSVDAFDNTARIMADRSFKPFRAKFADVFELDAEQGVLTSWSMALNGDYTEVDAFHASTGGVATIFMRKGDDFERITTSLKKENGERAMGTLLARGHPAYPLMLEGKTYTGRANLFGTPYMTHYEPVKDPAGRVVGIVFIGFDITAFQASLVKVVEEARFFDSGASFVIDPRQSDAEAVFVLHPTARGKPVLEAYPNAATVLAALRSEREITLSDTASLLDTDMSRPWLVKRQAQTGHWWVVAQVSDKEAMATHWATIYAFWALLGLAAVLIGSGTYWLIRRNVSQPLTELTEAVTALAQGDLSHNFATQRRDEIGRLVVEVEGMRQRFSTMMQDLRATADSIGTASQQIASGNQDLSGRTEQAASSLQETAASMEQLNSTVRQSADSARQANQLARTASEVAVRGGQVVGEVVSTMDDIHRSSQKINDIIGVIDGIAFQTNILALNAAVEAARAGEQGRGFAVVAGEVRNLAQRSAEAAKEIKGLIGASVDRVAQGSRLVADAGQTMQDIVGSIQRVSDIVGEITAAAGEQSDGIGQVNVAVNQLDQMTQQNAALVEQSAAAAESLKEQAARLAQTVSVFQVGAPSSAHRSAAPLSSYTPPAPRALSSKPAAAPQLSAPPKAAAPKAASAPAAAHRVGAQPSGAADDWESF